MKSTHNTHQFFKKTKGYVLVIAIYLFFLATLPYLNQLFIPCLKAIPGTSYAYDNCTTALALDHFIVFALIGFAVSLLVIFFRTYEYGFKPLITMGVILSILTVGSYYIYIAQAEALTAKAPIRLESLRASP